MAPFVDSDSNFPFADTSLTTRSSPDPREKVADLNSALVESGPKFTAGIAVE